MYKNKKVLLIAGGGTLGTYTAKELLRLGCFVDIICPEEKSSDNEKLKFYRGYATLEFLTKLFSENHYDGIVNFVHYPDVEEYKPFHKLLTDNTEHLIFLSSYRVYADLENPITENAPHLLDVTTDEKFLAEETYALSKAKAEKYLFNESNTDNWTVVRPVISFSEYRFDIVVRNFHDVIDYYRRGETMFLPAETKNLTASLDWAGNTGKIIANLLLKKDTFRQAYTISSAQNMKWGEVAELYTKLVGTQFEWIDTEEYLKIDECIAKEPWILLYDRLYDRKIDNTKVLKATGLKESDFLSIEEGLKIELKKFYEKEKLQ
ncbi:MAG: NAD-dependent epimerase/dehydratase family protein [Monoglobaceae bacterium]